MFPIRHSTRSRRLRQAKRLGMARARSFFSRMKPNMMQNLRERGIYALSDGREFVVHAVFRGGYVFYTPEDWRLFGPHAFESTADGHLRWNGEHEQWHTEDLIDTTR